MIPSTLLLVRSGSKRFLTNLKKLEKNGADKLRENTALKLSSARNFATSSRSSVALLHEAAFVNNELVQASNGETFPVVNPVNNEVIGSVPDMGVEDTEKVGLLDRF